MVDRLAALSDAGVSIWLDDLSRERLVSGGWAGLVRDEHVVGGTTHPTIFTRAIGRGHPHPAHVAGLSCRGAWVEAGP